MQFIIADTFQTSITKLDNPLQSLVKEAAFDFQMNPAQPGNSFHRIHKAIEQNFWSFRVNLDLRIIVYKDADRIMLCYADHHDAAYDWAQNRRMETHPVTNACQIVEVIERIEEVVKKIYTQQLVEPSLFEKYESDYLHALGVPQNWLHALKYVTESNVIDVLERLPQEAAERLMRLATGEAVPVPRTSPTADPFTHPDAQRRFHVIDNQTELENALAWPWEKWTTFLHPDQRKPIVANFNGPAYVSGGAGTGKTVVALHRAHRVLKDNPSAKLLLTTFSTTLANRLENSVNILMGENNDVRHRITITNLHAFARKLLANHSRANFRPMDRTQLVEHLEQARQQTDLDPTWTSQFLASEWESVVDAWGIRSWEEYRDFNRKGRGAPLDTRSRLAVWRAFEFLHDSMNSAGHSTWSRLCYDCIDLLQNNPTLQWDHIVTDESQDFGPAELRLLRALARSGPGDLFLVGDSGQQLYQRPFSWRDVGIEVVGRSSSLNVNYRTTEQIRRFSDNLMPANIQEHGGQQRAHKTISLLQGRPPEIHGFDSTEQEINFVAQHITNLLERGHSPRDIAIVGRTKTQVLKKRAIAAIKQIDAPWHWLTPNNTEIPDSISVGTMHASKGLEFKTVIVMGCEQSILPLPHALANCIDDVDREETLARERNLLYVSTTRAREQVVITHVGKPSEMLHMHQE